MKKTTTPLLLLITILFFMTTRTNAQSFGLAFDHHAILVRDLTESSNFYLNIMGLEEIENKTQKPHIRWFSMGGNTSLHVIEDKSHTVPDVKGVHFAIHTKNLDKFIEHLRANNIYFENWPGEPNKTNSRADGVRQIYLKDPNGYWIEVNEN
ncbi:VOC family protein [Galbibacter pacificus]|uniref:VOC family protein n=1 Tax=Galbibacter pacificus TaxID=2996052 RepID=A0ABT6FUK6_9FLAO|nr:VOC family protein [Galbibacter pacificus]MDG3583571.1 VOC family protein [Galbibacter pacificus]MDG3586953.1 VOC family protein [Galbibacter pacificus]